MDIFSDAEMRRHYDGLRAIMDGSGLDAVVTTSLHSREEAYRYIRPPLSSRQSCHRMQYPRAQLL